ncbi:MAG TPA: cysteine peptidase family C39 domain-containing protein, partial [Gammaproteobacteria bacterium]|nr:cysteine peptidase family C39 domain-containing protein [Gammaproteobacteria bacterium]
EQVRRRGFSLLDIKNYVQTVGLRGRGYQVNEEGLDSISIPTIVLLDIDGYKHFVVLKKVDGRYAYIGDPALGNRVMDRDEFVSAWNGVVFAVIGPNFDRNTVLLQPRGKVTARRLNDVYTPVPKARLLDFGFNHADLF